MTYRVSEIAQASPDMTDEEFQRLVDDIRERGQLVPIWKAGEEIIDGRKRLRACGLLGIEPKIIDVSADQSPADIAYSLNILRTHYTASQRAIFAAKRATMTKSGAVTRRHDRDEGRRRNYAFYGRSAEQAGREAGVDRATVVKAKALRRDAAPEVVAAVEAGTLTLHSATQIAAHVPVPDQPAAVAKVIEASAGKARNTPARALGIGTGIRRQPHPALEKRMESGLAQLEVIVDLLVKFVAEDEGFKQAWTRRLEGIRTTLTQVIGAARRKSA